MEKLQKLKKATTVSLITSAAIIIGSIGLATATWLYKADVEKTNDSLDREQKKLSADYKKLSREHEKAKASLSLYNKLTQSDEGKSLSLDRKNVATLLNELNENYLLSNLNLSIGPIQERTEKAFKRDSGTIISSEVQVDFRGITDEFAYAFLSEVVERFPGYVNLSGFWLTRIDRQIQRKDYDINSGPPTLIEAGMSFDWLGMQVAEKQKKNTKQQERKSSR